MKKRKASKTKEQPVEYMLDVIAKLTYMKDGSSVGFDLSKLPIHAGIEERWTPKKIAALLRTAADVIESQGKNPGSLDNWADLMGVKAKDKAKTTNGKRATA